MTIPTSSRIAEIRAGLPVVEASIVGVTTVFPSTPAQAPTEPQCPFIINDRQKPFLTFVVDAGGGVIRLQWHFLIKFGLRPWGVGTEDEWDDSIAPYPGRVLTALFGNMSLSDVTVPAPDMESGAMVGMIHYNGKSYFGFEIPWLVQEQIEISFTP
jgi:hypothetical protein